MEKGEIARNEQFLLFPQRFLLYQKIVSPFIHMFDIISLCAAELEKPKIGLSGKGLTSTPNNILSKPLAAFPHNNRQNNGRQ